jgi:hypothetical protein
MPRQTRALAVVGILTLVMACRSSVTSTSLSSTFTSATNLTRTTYGEVTTFTSSTECDPEADDADVQVVQAFVTAYNQRDSQRLSELVPETDEIWDIGGVPHLGTHLWTDIVAWAQKGWEVDDRLELVRMIRYGPRAGSDITVRRFNEVLAAAGISELTLLIKVPSDGCTIERLIAAVDTYESGGCMFYQTYIDQLTDLDIAREIPSSCGP